ncbi:MAG: hypothetical protein RSC44_05955, partial [Clostridia bacterium]
KTENTWKEYSLFIEGSKIEDGAVTVELSLGTGNKTSGHMTKGYAFFDEIKLTNLKPDGAEFTALDYKAALVNDSAAKYSMQLCDQNFDFVTDTTSTPYSPIKFAGKAGYGSGENAPSSTSFVERGIVTSQMTINDGASQAITITNPDERAASNKMLMINNKKLSAYGYRANTPMLIENSKVYKFSIKVRTLATSGTAMVKLSNGTDTDTLDFKYDKINTNGNWQTISMIIQGNNLRNNKVYLEMWAGFGGKDDTASHYQGSVFFDDATLEVVADTEYVKDAPYNFTLQAGTPSPIGLNGFKQVEKDDLMNDASRTTFKNFDIKDWATQGFACAN